MPESSQNTFLTVQNEARDIFNYALESVLPEPALRRYLKLEKKTNTLIVAGKEYKLKNYNKILVVGGGKAGRRTGAELVKILGDRITAGVLNVYLDQAKEPISDKIKLFGANHPTPNEDGVEGAKQMVELLKTADKKTLVFALISGGGSSLMAIPVEGISLDDYQEISKLLLTVPATIDEINSVRKHIDPLKGGGMRKFAEKAGGFISLVLSDVPVTKTGVVDDTSVIASGPTVGDDSTFESAKKVLTDHGIWDATPEAVKKYFEDNMGKQENETLPKDSPLLAENKSLYVMIANNDRAMEAARERAEQLGYSTQLIGWNTGSTDDKIKAEVTEEIENIWQQITPYLTNNDNITFGSFSTDGVDGFSDLAGAIANSETLKLAKNKGIDHKKHLTNYDSATFFKKLGLEIKTGATGTNVADISLVLITNPNNSYRKTAIIFGGEATVNVNVAEGKKAGYGGRNTHLTLLAAEKLTQQKTMEKTLDKKTIKQKLIKQGIAESQIDISDVGCMGYASDVGPISLIPRAVVGVRSHEDVEKAVKFAYDNNVPITARGAGSGLPAQSVGSGIVLDMRSLDEMKVMKNHPDGGKNIYVQSGAISTRLNNFLADYDVFLASYPASTNMATIGGMIANNSSGANSCKLGTTMHQVLDLHVVLSDGTGLWTSEIESDKEPWQKILQLVRENEDAIKMDFPKVAKNSSGYNVLDILNQLEKGVHVDWARLFAHSEGTLGIITEAKLRALPLAKQKATCIVYFTDLKEACSAIPEIYNLGPSCFDLAATTNLDLIRKAFPKLNISENAKVMYIIEFDDLEVKPDLNDPSRRIGKVGVLEEHTAAKLIQKQVEELKQLLKKKYPKTAIDFDMATDIETQDAFWVGRRSALQVLYAYDSTKIPLTMIECVVIPRDEKKLLEFITHMDAVFDEEEIVAGMHGHAGDCNFHIYPLLNLSQKQDRMRLINAMTKITEKVTELGGSMSGEHADGRTRGVILPYVFGKELFDLFVKIKDLMDARAILHPGSKIIRQARDKDLYQAIEDMVGIEEKNSQLNLAKFKDYSHLFSGVCSLCSQCTTYCPIFQKLPEQFSARTEAAPTFKRSLAIALEGNENSKAIKKDPEFKRIFDLCLLCGQCTYYCPTDASMRDMVAKIREDQPSKVIAPLMYHIRIRPVLYQFTLKLISLIQGIWQNKLSRRVISWLPKKMLPTSMPYKRNVPKFSKSILAKRYPELVNISPSEADIAYFHGCSSDIFADPIADSFLNIASHNNWKVSLPNQRCCGEPFAAVGNTEKYHTLARYNIDRLKDYKYIIAHCPSCLLAFKEYPNEFSKIGDKEYEKKSKAIVKKLYNPGQFIMEVIGASNLKQPAGELKQKVTVHLSCHEKLGNQITDTPNYTKDFLNLVPGLKVINMKGADECCGLGGPWGLGSHYDLSVKMREDKISNIIDSNADVVVSWCSGCMMQMRDGLGQAKSEIKTKHPLELLGEAYGQQQ